MQAPKHSESKPTNRNNLAADLQSKKGGVTVRAKNLKSTKATISKHRYRIGTRVKSTEAIVSKRRYRVGTGFNAPTWEATRDVEN